MIQVICRDSKILYNAYHLVKAFWDREQVTSEIQESLSSRICVRFSERPEIQTEDIRSLYLQLREMTGKELPWGMLTGVRPVKLASSWIAEHLKPGSPEEGQEAFVRWFYEDRFVSREKAETAYGIAQKEREILQEICSPEKVSDTCTDIKVIPGCSVYIGIPFCPTVCSYCSFSSGAVSSYEPKIDAYLDALLTEMEQKAGLWLNREENSGTDERPAYPTTIYIGGGTPTSLNEARLERLLQGAEDIFRIRKGLHSGRILEYTVEAGRPDSITEKKLELLKHFGVTRISINPQSMQQKTLDRIGRKHTVQQIRMAYALARKLGFDNINMDLIMGLPGETNADVLDTLRQIRELGPDSLTVHSLAIKRASAIGIARKTGKESPEAAQDRKPGEADIYRMIQDASRTARDMGMAPYYLYRQKSIAGNFENTGYAKPGKEGIYNILIMEEVQSIIGCGAGATTKTVTREEVPNPQRNGQGTLLLRSENVKNIEDYITRFGESGC